MHVDSNYIFCYTCSLSYIWFNPLTPGALCKKCILGHFGDNFSAWIWEPDLASIYSKRHLEHNSMPFFPLASCFDIFDLTCTDVIILRVVLHEKVTYILGLFSFFKIVFCLLFSPFLTFLWQ